MLNPKAFANAITVVMAVFYVICAAVSYVVPDFLFGIAQAWVHSLNLNVLKTPAPISLMSALWGGITLIVLTWVTTYATIWLYNKLIKN